MAKKKAVKKTVIISVHGGVAYVNRKPRDVKVIIRDYDSNEDIKKEYSEDTYIPVLKTERIF